jgi:hypothetical protein
MRWRRWREIEAEVTWQVGQQGGSAHLSAAHATPSQGGVADEVKGHLEEALLGKLLVGRA